MTTTKKPTFETLLIAEVKSRPLLWDVFNTDYHNKTLKKESWEEISIFLGVTESDCYKRWRSLRDRYVATIKNRHSSCKVGRKWKYMNDMMFLKDLTLGKRPGGAHKNSVQEKIVNFNVEYETDENLSHDNIAVMNDDETTTHFTFVEANEDDADEKLSINNDEPNVASATSRTQATLIKYLEQQNRENANRTNNNNSDPFLPVIGEFFEKVPAKHRMAFKMDVLNYVYKKFDELNA